MEEKMSVDIGKRDCVIGFHEREKKRRNEAQKQQHDVLRRKLSEENKKDLIANAESLTSEEVKDDKGQLYYVYEIDGVGTHSLILVTCARNKLYAHFVNAPTPDWNRDKDMLKHVHESFKTVGSY
ncbi:hypothetical protein PIB30_028171 [Stylosanthes scabra]|uniref:PsbP C-terminal domain-containing protein n=1 Tax=Stylosanthes scabra TaxID=79078 RepID=A0ABU6Z9L5_9FABA|nr:hypothetical protein [Stylosanthes scabra]